MQSLEITGMKEVERVFKQLPDVVKNAKGEIFETVGKELLADVQRRIGGSGRVSRVQEYQVGSGKGYVAVRAKAKTDLDGYAAGYVTNALENGHLIANRHILSASRVRGKYMYHGTQATMVPWQAERAADLIDAAILDAIERG